MALTTNQRKALKQGLTFRIRSPAQGAYGRRSGEIDNVYCFNRRTLDGLVKLGYMAGDNVGYVTTPAGQIAGMMQHEWVGRRVELARDFKTRGGDTFLAGDRFVVVSAHRGKLFLRSRFGISEASTPNRGIDKVNYGDVCLLDESASPGS